MNKAAGSAVVEQFPNPPEMQSNPKPDKHEMGIFAALIIIVLILSYSVYIYLKPDAIATIGHEDNLFEWLTALGFLGASVFFALTFLKENNLWFLGLAFIFFFGFGEEISWGQRILHFGTPQSVQDMNVQGEFNIHNLDLFNRVDHSHHVKTGIARLFEINLLFKLFSLGFGIALPILAMFSNASHKIISLLRIPVPPLQLGFFFIINWMVFRVMLDHVLQNGQIFQYYDTDTEIFEFVSAFIFLMISLSHFMTESSPKRVSYRDFRLRLPFFR